MSVEAMTIALHHSRAATGIAKLVLIGIANHDGDGGAWPAVATLAHYASTTPRSVQRAIADLERLGEVRRIVQGGGTRHTADYARPNLYEFLLRCPPDCDGSKNHRTRRRSPVVVDLDGLQEGSQRYPQPGDTASPGDTVSPGGVTRASPEPSSETSIERTADQPQTARAREQRLTWSHACLDGRQDTHERSKRTGACAHCGATEISYQVEI